MVQNPVETPMTEVSATTGTSSPVAHGLNVSNRTIVILIPIENRYFSLIELPKQSSIMAVVQLATLSVPPKVTLSTPLNLASSCRLAASACRRD